MFGAHACLFALVVIIVSGAEAVRADQNSVRKSLPETDIIACIKVNDTLDEPTRSSMQQRCVRDAQLYCADKQPDCIAQIVTSLTDYYASVLPLLTKEPTGGSYSFRELGLYLKARSGFERSGMCGSPDRIEMLNCEVAALGESVVAAFEFARITKVKLP